MITEAQISEIDQAWLDAYAPSLVKLHRLVSRVLPQTQGALVLQCLLAYESSQLDAVHAWARALAPNAYPEGAGARARAAELYADCFLVRAEIVDRRKKAVP